MSLLMCVKMLSFMLSHHTKKFKCFSTLDQLWILKATSEVEKLLQ